MTDPTVKGYTAPTRELNEVPFVCQGGCGKTVWIRLPYVGDILCVDCCKGQTISSNLPAKAAPAVNICVDPNCDTCATGERLDRENESISQACSKCGQSEYHTGEYPCEACGRPTTWDDAPKGPSRMDQIMEYIMSPSPKPAPESEDEAFERWFSRVWPEGAELVRGITQAAWNARARLDAERER